MKTTIVTYRPDGARILWSPITLDQIGKKEEYLESVLAETPKLLCLETRRTGVYEPYAIFRQLSFATPQSRRIKLDILLLAASGDVIIVEVKLFANPELRDRRVIAQAIDYAASLSALSDTELARLFSGNKEVAWAPLVNSLFPEDEDPDELSTTLLTNIKTGNIHIIVACDKAPVGLYEIARSVSIQKALNFSLEVLEVTPFSPKTGASDEIMFVSNVGLSTETVARTAITVTYEQGSPKPSVNIETTSMDQIEENIAALSQGQKRQDRKGREWTNQAVEEFFMSSDDPVARELFLFAKQYSHRGQLSAPGHKMNASFGFYISRHRQDGSDPAAQCFKYADDGLGTVRLYLRRFAETDASKAVVEDYMKRLAGLFGQDINVGAPEPGISIAAVGEKLEEFKALVIEFQKDIEATNKA